VAQLEHDGVPGALHCSSEFFDCLFGTRNWSAHAHPKTTHTHTHTHGASAVTTVEDTGTGGERTAGGGESKGNGAGARRPHPVEHSATHCNTLQHTATHGEGPDNDILSGPLSLSVSQTTPSPRRKVPGSMHGSLLLRRTNSSSKWTVQSTWSIYSRLPSPPPVGERVTSKSLSYVLRLK